MSAGTITITAGRPNRQGDEKDFSGPDGTYTATLVAVSEPVTEKSNMADAKGDGTWTYRTWTFAIGPDGEVLDTRAKHERGGHNGADPFGYRAARDELGRVVQPHRLEVVPGEADLVRLVFDRYGAGDVSHGRLAEALRAEGLTRRGRPWVEKGVQDILRRADLYLGKAVYRRGQDVREGTHEPIITPEQAHLARQAAARRQRSTAGRQQRGRVYLLAQLLHCSCGTRMRGETQVRRGREAEWRYYRCPGRRDGRCAAGGWRIRADAVEALVLDHLAAHRTPPEELPYLREELSRLTHLPDDGLRAQRKRIETAMKRLGDRYTWQEIGEAEYRAERRRLEAMLVELPLPAESNLVAFDRAAALYEEIGAILSDTTREHQRQIILAIVESVRATDGGVSEIRVRPEARPFFGDYVAGETVADEQAPLRTAVGYWRPRTDSNRRRAP